MQDYQGQLREKLDPSYIKKTLNEDELTEIDRSYYIDYKVIREEQRRWCRASVVIVDLCDDGSPNHVLVLFKDITKQKEKDNGIGMSEEFAEHIFEPFTREETSTVSRIPGTGLGMAITKNIVDMMGGTIKVKSELGVGSEFTISLRFKTTQQNSKRGVIKELNGFRALVADDSMDSCASVEKMLRTIGLRPEWTTSGKEAIFRAKYASQEKDPFQVYIIDWLMPDMNGIEVVRRIRMEIGDEVPIIILTAYDWADIEQEAREAGVTAFCAKPLFVSELYDVLQNASRPVKTKDKAIRG